MLYFENDYGFGAHPAVLERLVQTNMEPVSGYGTDPFTASAVEKIKAACGCPEGQVFFITGGTQTNMLVIDAMLRKYEGVVAAETGHVSVHEAGAIEFTGHKVLTVPEKDGKMSAEALEKCLSTFWNDPNHDHMVFPGMVYISHPTEFGTLYSRQELEELSAVCRRYEIPLYMDGARMGYGLAASEDVTLREIAACCDAFYIGGTKCGTLCGEAVVFPRGAAPKQFVTMTKQHGALLAKGRLSGVQFDAMFTDGLYEKICRPAVELAMRLQKGLREKGYRIAFPSPTNQQFVILEDAMLDELRRQQVAFSYWERYDEGHSIIRLATSWATTEQQVDELLTLF
ncbi:MAG: threonine aldolase family protein [Agathobaculum sp.]